jgi:hypothetical protein
MELLTADGPNLPAITQWGLFGGGGAAVTADNVVAFELKKNWYLADYPVEGGGFESYDKVAVPYDVRLRFSAGYSAGNRAALLNSIDRIAGDLNLYDAVTPEKTYPNVNVTHYDFRRTADRGAGLIQLDVWLLEVRSGSSSVFGSGAQGASASSASFGGNVQAK